MFLPCLSVHRGCSWAEVGRAWAGVGHVCQRCVHGQGEGTCMPRGMHSWGWVCVCQGACVAEGACMPGSCMAGVGMRSGETAAEAGATHPTGMSSCFKKVSTSFATCNV